VRRFGFAVIRGPGIFCVMNATETRCFTTKAQGLQTASFGVGDPDWISAEAGGICLGFPGSMRCSREWQCLGGSWTDTPGSVKEFDDKCQSNTVADGKFTPETFFRDRLGRCVLNSAGAACGANSGNYFYRAQSVPGATKMAVGWGFICTVEQKELVCRAYKETAFQREVRYYEPSSVLPDMKIRVRDPKLLVAGWHHGCAWGMDKLTCFGLNDKGQTAAPALRGVVELLGGDEFTCARHAGGADCWGDVPGNLKGIDPFGLVVRGLRNGCLTKGQTVDCSAHEMDFTFETWEAFNGFLQEQFLRLPRFQFRFEALEKDLREVARAGYAPKSRLLRSLADFLEKRAPVAGQTEAYILSFKNASARLLAMMALEPIVREIGNRNQQLTGEYTAALDKVKKGMGVDGMDHLDKFPIVHRMAQALIREGLRAVRESVGSGETDEALGKLIGELSELEIRLGDAPTDADIEAASREYADRIRQAAPLISGLLLQTRGRSLLEMVLEVAKLIN
jgi:hypothetical protein